MALPALAALRNLDAASRQTLAELLREIQLDARLRADRSWKAHKAPMALYWKAVSVYAGHIARAVKPHASPRNHQISPATHAEAGAPAAPRTPPPAAGARTSGAEA